MPGALVFLQKPIQKDKEMLQGAWAVESGQMAGQVISDEDKQKWKVIFNGDELTFEEVPYPGFTLYPEESPKAIDIWTMDLPLKAIYKLEEGKLHLCTGDTTERPREFQTGAQDQFLYLILKREKR